MNDLGNLFPEAPQQQREGSPYRVLARKYRPSNFDQLIGQDALVRTLTNAFAQNRIAHAFMLTGVRGVGKTTTARIIAKALNCIGPDGTGGPTIAPCGVCENCTAIAADRHVDVLEMDAASRTGVDDVRELIEGVRYAPAAARYKVYIVDEVHMLSKAAFNALLKTLEEPPPHVKFIFATTEIRKVPVTVLSRCQRFDLRRVDSALLIAHFGKIAEAEKVATEPAALALIARAADGSVRDGLSLLDQAIARGDGTVGAEQVRDMLGLADRALVLDLFEAVLGGDAPAALAILDGLHSAGADPAAVLEDLLEFTHFVTRMKQAPGSAGADASDGERVRAAGFAERLSLPALTRTWQILLKGLGELQAAPNPQAAAEMVILRLTYAADLPSPADLVRQIRESGGAVSTGAPPPAERGGPPSRGPAAFGGGSTALSLGTAPEAALPLPEAPQRVPEPQSFAALVALFGQRNEHMLEYNLSTNVRLVRFEPGVLEFNPLPAAPPNLANKVGSLLSSWTGRRWMVGISSAPGEETLSGREKARKAEIFDDAANSPVVRAVMEHFPGAVITDVRELAAEQPESGLEPGEPMDASNETGDES